MLILYNLDIRILITDPFPRGVHKPARNVSFSQTFVNTLPAYKLIFIKCQKHLFSPGRIINKLPYAFERNISRPKKLSFLPRRSSLIRVKLIINVNLPVIIIGEGTEDSYYFLVKFRLSRGNERTVGVTPDLTRDIKRNEFRFQKF